MVKIPPSNANQDWDVWFTRFMAIPPNALGSTECPTVPRVEPYHEVSDPQAIVPDRLFA